MSVNLGDAVKAARLASGLSARELAKAAGLSHSYVSQLEAGVISAPSPGVLKRLSEAVHGLNYWKMLVMAGYISRTDELGENTDAEDFEAEASFGGNSPPDGLVAVKDGALASRLIQAVTGTLAFDEAIGGNGRKGLKRNEICPPARVAILGAIPAGDAPVVPAGAADAFEAADLPPGVKGAGPFVALTVRGDSMNGAGLLDGDLVIIDRGAAARDGDVCAARIEGGEPTLKRVHFANDCAILAPANPAFSPIAVNLNGGEERLEIIGRVVFSQRIY